jgi:hypothetical protein
VLVDVRAPVSPPGGANREVREERGRDFGFKSMEALISQTQVIKGSY